MGNKKKPNDPEILQVGYEPPEGYGLDVEVFPVSTLRQRVSAEMLEAPERIEFYLLVYVTEGRCMHMADFEPIAGKPGSLLVLKPGQVQRFDTSAEWDGWLVIFRPEFRLSRESARLSGAPDMVRDLDELQVHLALNESEQQAVTESITRMFHDAQLPVSCRDLHALLRNQLHALLLRLHLIAERGRRSEPVAAKHMQRFKRYRRAVEQELHRWHRVADYVELLGCSQKTLCRAVQESAGVSAKAFLTQRIVLEAKRLLVHTELPISTIADRLGFDEATNFTKFFRREAGCSPADFRKPPAVSQTVRKGRTSEAVVPESRYGQSDPRAGACGEKVEA